MPPLRDPAIRQRIVDILANWQVTGYVTWKDHASRPDRVQKLLFTPWAGVAIVGGMSTKRYPTDLTDPQWRRIATCLPKDARIGRPAKYSKRDILNAILYVTRNGCTWRALPHDFPPYRIVFHWFRKWQRDGTWRRIHHRLRRHVRRNAGRKPKSRAGVLDSQTVKSTEHAGPRGYGGGKKDRRPQTARGR